MMTKTGRIIVEESVEMSGFEFDTTDVITASIEALEWARSRIDHALAALEGMR